MQILKDRFNRLLLGTLLLLLTSGTVTFFVLANSSSVVTADQAFRDIPLDHPVYQLCRQLIRIGAVRPRPGMTLEPFEKISASDWNHALMQIGKHSARVIPEAAKFGSNDEVCADSICRRLQSLAPDECELLRPPSSDSTRLAVYFMLERCLLE
ncbi:MAG: hypothetical protein KKB51_07710 [Candidatus Riflebacteria bacterium]|nr:hypothetical protein [Candidatus Riflebacteria bacterium]